MTFTDTVNRLPLSAAVAIPQRKTFPWKNVPSWSPLYKKLQRDPTSYLYNAALDIPHIDADSDNTTTSAFKCPLEEFTVIITDQSKHALEVPETPAATSITIRREGAYRNDGKVITYS